MKKKQKNIIALLVLVIVLLVAYRFAIIEDCYPSKGFFDFGKSNDSIERICGQSTDNPWKE